MQNVRASAENLQVPIEWNTTKLGQNALHIVALYARVEIMRLLTNEDLVGWDPILRDCDDATPDDCFVHHRDRVCTIIRDPFEEEEEAWIDLLLSACRQNDIDPSLLGSIRASASEDEGEDGDEEYEDDEDDEVDANDDDEAEKNFVDAQEEFVDGSDE